MSVYKLSTNLSKQTEMSVNKPPDNTDVQREAIEFYQRAIACVEKINNSEMTRIELNDVLIKNASEYLLIKGMRIKKKTDKIRESQSIFGKLISHKRKLLSSLI